MEIGKWKPGKYFACDIVKDGKFTFMAKDCIEQSVIHPSEDLKNWHKLFKNSDAVVNELDGLIKTWKLYGRHKDVIEILEDILYL